MMNFIFYSYLKWLKDNKETAIYRALKLPLIIKILLIILLVAICTYIVSLTLGYTIASYISMSVLLIGCILSSIYLERHQIKNAMKNFDDYKKYCYKLYDWLKTYNISQKEELIIIRDRTINQINSMKDFSNKRKAEIVSWLKVIIIPVVLVCLNKLIENQTDFEKVVILVIQFIIMCTACGSIAYVFWLIINISLKNRIDKYKCFANDLQTIIDIEFGLEN